MLHGMSGELEDIPLVFVLPSEARQKLMQECVSYHGTHNWWLVLDEEHRIWIHCMRCPASLDDVAAGAHSSVHLVHSGVTITSGMHDAPPERVGEEWPVRFQIRDSQSIWGLLHGADQGVSAGRTVTVTVL